MHPVPRIVAIVLAAGESRRMGKPNKLFLQLAGEPLLKRTINTLLASNISEIIVVLGHDRGATETLLQECPVKIVFNPNFLQGQMSSVYAGMEIKFAPCDGIMICLADQPLLTADDINRLVDGFQRRGTKTILVPTWQGQRGNPIILAYEHRQRILQGEQNLGCRRLVEKHPDWVHTMAMYNDHFTTDMDTPEAYQIAKQRLKSQSHNASSISSENAPKTDPLLPMR